MAAQRAAVVLSILVPDVLLLSINLLCGVCACVCSSGLVDFVVGTVQALGTRCGCRLLAVAQLILIAFVLMTNGGAYVK
jgi:hypothetical protein